MSKKAHEQVWHYSRLEDEMTTSPAWRKLSGNACKLYIEFHRYGRSRGYFYKTYTSIQKDLGFSTDTCNRAITQLIKYGFIDLVEKGGITRHEVNKDGYTCWNKSTYKLSGRWKQIEQIPG